MRTCLESFRLHFLRMRSLWNAAKMSGKLIFFSFFFFRLEKKKGFSFPQLLIVHENPLCKSRSREPPPEKSSSFSANCNWIARAIIQNVFFLLGQKFCQFSKRAKATLLYHCLSFLNDSKLNARRRKKS